MQRRTGRKRISHGTPEISAAQSAPTGEEELVRQPYGAIRQLPQLDGALGLRHLDGLNYRDMSEVLGLMESDVGVKPSGIRKQLTVKTMFLEP